MYFDAHTHLNSDQLYPHWQTYLQHFIDVGGQGLINIGVNDERNQRAIHIAQESSVGYPDIIVKATIGYHPGEVSFGHIKNDKDIYHCIDTLKRLHDAHAPHVVAIGECGIDAHYDGYENIKTVQEELFHHQALLARERRLPLVIHSRDHFEDTYAVLKHYTDLKIYFHCRGYTPEDIITLHTTFPYLRIGFCGNTTYPKAQQLRDSLQTLYALQEKKHEAYRDGHHIHLLLETDAPYLTPQEKRGTTNEPTHIIYLYDAVSEYVDIDKNILSSQVGENVKRLYTI